MRKASMVLGIVGGTIALLIALVTIFAGIFMNTTFTSVIDESENNELVLEENIELDESMDIAVKLFTGLGIVILIAGILGIVGGAIVNKNNIVAGILMLIGCVVCLFTVWAIISFILLLLGGIFALVNDNSNKPNNYETFNSEESNIDMQRNYDL